MSMLPVLFYLAFLLSFITIFRIGNPFGDDIVVGGLPNLCCNEKDVGKTFHRYLMVTRSDMYRQNRAKRGCFEHYWIDPYRNPPVNGYCVSNWVLPMWNYWNYHRPIMRHIYTQAHRIGREKRADCRVSRKNYNLRRTLFGSLKIMFAGSNLSYVADAATLRPVCYQYHVDILQHLFKDVNPRLKSILLCGMSPQERKKRRMIKFKLNSETTDAFNASRVLSDLENKRKERRIKKRLMSKEPQGTLDIQSDNVNMGKDVSFTNVSFPSQDESSWLMGSSTTDFVVGMYPVAEGVIASQLIEAYRQVLVDIFSPPLMVPGCFSVFQVLLDKRLRVIAGKSYCLCDNILGDFSVCPYDEIGTENFASSTEEVTSCAEGDLSLDFDWDLCCNLRNETGVVSKENSYDDVVSDDHLYDDVVSNVSNSLLPPTIPFQSEANCRQALLTLFGPRLIVPEYFDVYKVSNEDLLHTDAKNLYMGCNVLGDFNSSFSEGFSTDPGSLVLNYDDTVPWKNSSSTNEGGWSSSKTKLDIDDTDLNEIAKHCLSEVETNTNQDQMIRDPTWDLFTLPPGCDVRPTHGGPIDHELPVNTIASWNLFSLPIFKRFQSHNDSRQQRSRLSYVSNLDVLCMMPSPASSSEPAALQPNVGMEYTADERESEFSNLPPLLASQLPNEEDDDDDDNHVLDDISELVTTREANVHQINNEQRAMSSFVSRTGINNRFDEVNVGDESSDTSNNESSGNADDDAYVNDTDSQNDEDDAVLSQYYTNDSSNEDDEDDPSIVMGQGGSFDDNDNQELVTHSDICETDLLVVPPEFEEDEIKKGLYLKWAGISNRTQAMQVFNNFQCDFANLKAEAEFLLGFLHNDTDPLSEKIRNLLYDGKPVPGRITEVANSLMTLATSGTYDSKGVVNMILKNDIVSRKEIIEHLQQSTYNLLKTMYPTSIHWVFSLVDYYYATELPSWEKHVEEQLALGERPKKSRPIFPITGHVLLTMYGYNRKGGIRTDQTAASRTLSYHRQALCFLNKEMYTLSLKTHNRANFPLSDEFDEADRHMYFVKNARRYEVKECTFPKLLNAGVRQPVGSEILPIVASLVDQDERGQSAIQDLFTGPVDQIFPAGIHLRNYFGLPEQAKAEDFNHEDWYNVERDLCRLALKQTEPDGTATSKEKTPRALAINNLLSPDLAEKIIEYYKTDRAVFSTLQNKNGHYRLTCRNGKTKMKLGENHYLRSIPAQTLDKLQMDLAGNIIDAIIDMINEQFELKGMTCRATPQTPNCVHHFCGKRKAASYGFHNDCFAMGISDGPLQSYNLIRNAFSRWTNNDLPHDQMLMVLTTCLSVNRAHKAKLYWSSQGNEFQRTATKNGTADPGDLECNWNSCHIQLMGTQAYGILHGSKSDHFDRLVSSFRLYLVHTDPGYLDAEKKDVGKRTENKDYNLTEMLSDKEMPTVVEPLNVDELNANAEWNHNGRPITSYDKKTASKIINGPKKLPFQPTKDKLDELKKTEYMELYEKKIKTHLPGLDQMLVCAIYLQEKLVGLPSDRLYKHLCRYSFIVELFRKGTLLQVVFQDVKVTGERVYRHLLPLINDKLLIPGDRILRTSVDLVSTLQKNQLIVFSDHFANLVCPARAYKNEPLSFWRSMRWITDWRKNYDRLDATGKPVRDVAELSPDYKYNTLDDMPNDYEGEVRICLSGGSLMNQGTHVPSASRMSTKDTAVVADFAQHVESPQTRMFFEAAADKRVFGMLRRESTWLADKGARRTVDTDEDALYFHGYMYIDSINYRSMTDDQVIKRFSFYQEYKDYYDANKDCTTFLLNCFFEVTFLPVLHPADYVNIALHNRDPECPNRNTSEDLPFLKTVTLSANDKTRVADKVNKDSSQASHDLIKFFQSSSQWKRFCEQQEQNSVSADMFVTTMLSGITNMHKTILNTEKVRDMLIKYILSFETYLKIQGELKRLSEGIVRTLAPTDVDLPSFLGKETELYQDKLQLVHKLLDDFNKEFQEVRISLFEDELNHQRDFVIKTHCELLYTIQSEWMDKSPFELHLNDITPDILVCQQLYNDPTLLVPFQCMDKPCSLNAYKKVCTSLFGGRMELDTSDLFSELDTPTKRASDLLTKFVTPFIEITIRQGYLEKKGLEAKMGTVQQSVVFEGDTSYAYVAKPSNELHAASLLATQPDDNQKNSEPVNCTNMELNDDNILSPRRQRIRLHMPGRMPVNVPRQTGEPPTNYTLNRPVFDQLDLDASRTTLHTEERLLDTSGNDLSFDGLESDLVVNPSLFRQPSEKDSVDVITEFRVSGSGASYSEQELSSESDNTTTESAGDDNSTSSSSSDHETRFTGSSAQNSSDREYENETESESEYEKDNTKRDNDLAKPTAAKYRKNKESNITNKAYIYLEEDPHWDAADDGKYMTTACQLVRVMTFAQIACAVRATFGGGTVEKEFTKGKRKTVEGFPTKLFATPIFETKLDSKETLEAGWLPNVFKRVPTPAPLRALDVGCNYIRETLVHAYPNVLQMKKLYRLPFSSDSNPLYHNSFAAYQTATYDSQRMVDDIIFRSLVYHTTGRALRFDEYGLFLQKTNRYSTFERKACIPNPSLEEVDCFDEFIEAYTWTENGNMKSKFEGRQHGSHIPDAIKERHSYNRFLLALVNAMEANATAAESESEATKEFFGYTMNAAEPLNRDRAMYAIRSTLMLCLTGSSGTSNQKIATQVTFLAHQALADVEELVTIPFGQVTASSVGCGSGGSHGACLYEFGSAVNPSSTKGQSKLLRIHNELVEHLLTEDKELLAIVGLEISRGIVRWKYHKRAYCLTDTEHWLCKLSIICKNNHTSRNTSGKPVAHRTDCWPRIVLRLIHQYNTTYGQEVQCEFMHMRRGFINIMQKQAGKEATIRGSSMLIPPRHILFEQELAYWTVCPKTSRDLPTYPELVSFN